jgi:hypothetical protein
VTSQIDEEPFRVLLPAGGIFTELSIQLRITFFGQEPLSMATISRHLNNNIFQNAIF